MIGEIVVSLRKKLLFLFLISSLSYSQTNLSIPAFENISLEDGLPENSVTCILQDHFGYLWLGTQNGLARYDGYTMTNYYPEKDADNTSQKGIIVIYEDKTGELWIGTLNGLFKFDRAEETFKSYKYADDNIKSISSDKIHSIYEDEKGRFWVGTHEGLNLLDRSDGTFTRYYFTESDSNVLSASAAGRYYLPVNALIEDPVSGDILIGTDLNGLWAFKVEEKILSKYCFEDDGIADKKIGWIQAFYKTKDGKIWMASFHTLSRFDSQTKEVKTLIEFPIIDDSREKKPSFCNGSICADKNGLIWCGFYEGEKGIFSLNPVTEDYRQHKLFPDDPLNSYSDKIYSLYEDRTGILWIGTWGTGLFKWDRVKNKFWSLKNDPNNINSLSHSFVNSLTYDQNGFIWFSTRNGLDKYNINTGKFQHYLQNEPLVNNTPIYACISDRAGDIWLGTINQGLIRFNPKNESYKFYFNDPAETTNLSNKIIAALIQDSQGFLWIGTDGFGLYKYDINKNKLTHYKHDPNDPLSLSQNQPRVLFEDRIGTLWVGTNLGGLNKFDRKTETFIKCGFSCVLAVHEDLKGNFWVGDYFSGLNLYDRTNDSVITFYGKEDGVASNSIWGILEDDHNNLWIKTDNGLLKFNTNTRTIKHFTREDGLADNFFSPFGQCKGPDGTMFFNTGKGLVVFNPDSIKDDTTVPKVLLSGLSLFNRPGQKIEYDGFVSELEEVILPCDQNDLRFDYVGLHFSEPLKNKYKYILENFDQDWIDAGNQRNATYTNLDPGDYVFKVLASNRDGVWSGTEASIKIIILNPWWETWWAYLIYSILVLSLIYFTWKMQLKRIKVKHDFDMSKLEADKFHQIDEMKTRFFTNISHEFRTPLTLILGPVKQLAAETEDEKVKERLSVVYKSTKKLISLVNQLLDISKLESGKMKLLAVEQNIIPLLKFITLSFSSYAEKKQIALVFNSIPDEIKAFVDRDKIEKIVTNLLSNAFKFTPENGRIELLVTKGGLHDFSTGSIKGESVIIRICDTGIGIPQEKLPKIFDRFYQVDSNHTKTAPGTGIGLALTKELVELHYGNIKIESEEGKGTLVIITLPIGSEHLKPEEISAPEKNPETDYYPKEDLTFMEEAKQGSAGNEITADFDKPVLLIIEDNSDVRNYIKDSLNGNYSIVEASDGEEGWAKSVKHLPDLIISDVMMPKMDGFELCTKLKTDEITSHIPVIMLTAKASSLDKIAGFETGADDYIMKPFEPDELKARIKNLIEQRKRIHNHFKNHGIIDLDETGITSVDKKFLIRTLQTISDKISESSFNVEALAEKLAVSRTVLHKKVTSLTGEPPVELIKRIRLNTAAQLIEKKFGNITEIALEVGFNNPAYFSECFKKHFGVPPSHYSRQMTKN